MKKRKKVQVGVIYWKDATMHSPHSQYSRREIKNELSITSGVAAGLIAYEDEERITLALDCFAGEAGMKPWRNLASYPKSGISRIDRFEQVARKKKK